MGRFWGRRPDQTEKIGRAIRHHLDGHETVIAGVHVQSPGTHAAGLAGGVSGAVAGATGTPFSTSGLDSAEHDRWEQEAARTNVDARSTRRAVNMYLVLTDRRLLLVRRSRLTGRAREVLAEWPLAEGGAIRVPRNAQALILEHAQGSLHLELPLAHKFLPDVYRELPRLHRDACEAAGGPSTA